MNGFGIIEREQQYVHMKSKKKEICKWQCESESEINGQRRLSSSKRF